VIGKRPEVQLAEWQLVCGVRPITPVDVSDDDVGSAIAGGVRVASGVGDDGWGRGCGRALDRRNGGGRATVELAAKDGRHLALAWLSRARLVRSRTSRRRRGGCRRQLCGVRNRSRADVETTPTVTCAFCTQHLPAHTTSHGRSGRWHQIHNIRFILYRLLNFS
jgi:hypothetical protein